MTDPKETLLPVLDQIGIQWNDALLYPSFNGKDLSGHLPPFGTVERPTAEYNLAQARSLDMPTREAILREARLLIKIFDYEDLGRELGALPPSIL